MMGKAIPDRWLNYRPIGDRIAGTRFIAFKVPLRENINETIEDEQIRLAPHSLLESVPNLGLIVDLTNTARYYSPRSFTDKNVEHKKLMIPGRQTPSKELAQRFCKYVTSFLATNSDNDKLIGVHCTHGVNRTGYLICYFMITHMNMLPRLAIQSFGNARGHTIERENYTESLQLLVPSQQKPVSSITNLRSLPRDNQSTNEHHSWTGQQRQWRMKEKRMLRSEEQDNATNSSNYKNNYHRGNSSGSNYSGGNNSDRRVINNYRGGSSYNYYNRDGTQQNFQFRRSDNSNAPSMQGQTNRFQYYDNY